MNAAHMIRRFEAGGFNRDQATCLAETISDEVESTVATKEFVELTIERATSRLATAEEVADLARNMATRADLERMATKSDIRDMATKSDIRDMATKSDLEGLATKEALAELKAELLARMNEQTRWFAGIILVQTVAILTAAVTIARFLG